MSNAQTMLVCGMALLACAAHAADTSILPEDRRMDWRPGIPGGIPAYPVFANVKAAPYNAKGDGQADDTAAIQKALHDCPEGQAVLVPAGIYRLTTQLDIAKGVVLRGEGPEKTRLVNESLTKHGISICNYDNPVSTRIVKGGAKGSTSISVEDASRMKAGDLLLIDQLNDPDLVELQGQGGLCKWAGREDGKRAMGQLVQLAAKDGNNLTLNRPLAIEFKAALAAEATRSTDKVIAKAGVEDLYFEFTKKHTDDTSSIKIWNAVHCWVKNVESSRGWSYGHVTLKKCLGCEVRDSYFHHAHFYGSGHGYAVLVTAQSTDTLVENNVCYHLNTGPQVSSSGPGNVIAYNYSFRTFGRDYPETNWAHSDLCQHAAHPFLNLFEGNQVGTVCFDFYWGSSSHNTLFRNAVDMRNSRIDGAPMTQNLVGFRLDKRSRYNSALGNVLGHEGMQGQYQNAGAANFGAPLVWALGHPGDPDVAKTLLRHGNFDYVTKQVQWDPRISERKLPDSLYLSAKPAFFGQHAWPPIGPDRAPMVGDLPARERFLKVPAAEREAQDLLYLGEYQAAAGKKAEASAAFQALLAKYPSSLFAAAAKAHLEKKE
ncbi:MAG: hypothetical protein M5U26_25200 [Planctomycetota bacterium]|nr:hypothetical protein [Planctomycetota bacterium]